MGFLNKFFGPKPPKYSSSDSLRDALVEAALSNKEKLLRDLLSTHRQLVDDHCEEWTKAPEVIRNDKAAIGRYVNGIVAIALALAELGEPKLLEKLKGGGDAGNPLTRWEGVMTQAQSLMGEWKYDEAHALLENHLIDSRELIGSGVERYRSITLGMISQCRFHRGDIESAVSPARTAVEICEKAGDLDGIHAYLHTLFEIRRYQGETEEAARLLDRLAEVSTRRGAGVQSQDWSRRAALVRAGEPLCRVLVVIDGRRYEVEHAPAVREQHVQFEFERNRLALGRSNALVQKGAAEGSNGRTEEALALFLQARCLDAFNPEPHYQAGVALMELGRSSEAVEELRTTEELAPGWFQCRSDLWLAEQLVLGSVHQDIWKVLRALQDAPATPEQKLSFAEIAISRCGDLAPLHLHHGEALAAIGRRDQAAAAFHKGIQVAKEPDIRTRLLVQLAQILPAGKERTAFLSEAVALKGNLVAAATAAYVLRFGA